MKTIINTFNILMIFLLLFGGCNSRLKRQDTGNDKRMEAEKRFDPLAFAGDERVVTGRGRQMEKTDKTEASVTIDTSSSILPMDGDSVQPGEDEQAMTLFRVQVFASKSFDEAQEFAAQIEPLFDEGVYVEYQVPYYKVRIGEFYNSDDGENFLEEIKRLGFKNAWLVRVIE